MKTWLCLMLGGIVLGCAAAPRVYTLRVGDICVVPDPPYSATITRKWCGLEMRYSSPDITNRPDAGGFMFEADMGAGNVAGSYGTADTRHLLHFTFVGTNWEYGIRHMTDSYRTYSLDTNGDGIPDYRDAWDGTNQVVFGVCVRTNHVE